MSGGHLSKEFFELVKSIGESRSKQEEDKIILQEIAVLKQNLAQPNISAKKMKEYMVRAIYVEMLGHDASFAYIHAVKLAHEKNLLAKRIGYLTCNLFLHKDHELMLLLINTMQRDLNSTNHLEVCAALTSVTRLVNLEMIPAISPLVFKLLSHAQESVRKKTIIAVNRFFKLVPETVLDQKDLIRKVLCDPDPSVMGASLHILYEVAKSNPAGCKDLVPSFVSILKQITEHRLPRDFDYHRMPAPWLQVKLLSILGLLGTADQKASEQMYDILQECMRRADCGVNVGYAIIYECVRTITRIYPEHSLLELAASNISRFISSDNHNLKYLGVTGLSQIVQVSPSYAAEHQMVVVDCLEDPDDTLKRKTLDLLFRMTNPANVEVVVDKLTFHLKTSVDEHLRRDLVQKVTSLAERFAPNNEWYLTTMNTVFELGGDLVPSETAYNLMRLVAEGTGEDEETDMQFRQFAVNTYLNLLEKSAFHYDVLVQVIGWVLGEYACLANVDGYELEDIIDLLCDCVDRQFEDSATRGYLVTALVKLVGQNNLKSTSVNRVIRSYRSSRLTDLQQRCYEFEQLCANPALMRKVLPYDASCEDIDVKPGLPFLDGFVQLKLNEGAKEYQDEATRRANKGMGVETIVETESSKPTLNFTPYPEAQLRPPPPVFQPAMGGGGMGGDSMQDRGGAGGAGGGGMGQPEQLGLNVSGPRKWTAQGYNADQRPKDTYKPEPEKPTPPPPPSSQPSNNNSGYNNSDYRKPNAAAAPPAQMSEKEKMAAALFGGIGGNAPARPATSQQSGGMFGGGAREGPFQPPERRHQQETRQAAAPAPAPAPAAPAPSGGDMLDLLDLDGGAPSAPSQPPAPAAPAAPPSHGDMGGMGDLLDFDGTASAPVAAAPAAPTYSQPSPPPQDDLLFDIGAPAPSQAPAPPQQPVSAPADDLSGLLGAPTPAAPVQAQPPPQPELLPQQPLAPQPILGPMQVTTPQVGQVWGTLASERKASLQTSAPNWQELMGRMQARLQVHPVEVIGAEGICAGRILPGNDPCFLHGKLAPPRLDILVRCQDPNVAQRVADMCVQLLP
mmetsp:Transcript_60097/g.143211  ORF Transcript_60097/g.143211 Transcript_60097/m.143211 type:complete len:1071 (+) Transcript_60097:145-3357(+)|eukprot:CAMPEP_0178407522 /NCGR_PEP_ID=MMETSP0689_2-20121128/19472_1 /TAXON_ID=160604 /ORGANISM="Amphidinium massartii, Strain CS-259" /LENGTH=1070 /DNA_ID=CAMNT_0020028599 /DNA_START=63 /DNA_END=3275 /DNA_ORIENTATION=-